MQIPTATRGNIVEFQSVSVTNNRTYKGKILDPETDWLIAQNYGAAQLTAFNESCMRQNSSIPEDITSLNWFMMQTSDSLGKSTIIPFAYEWIDPKTWVIVEPGKTVTLDVVIPTGKTINDIILFLASGKYQAFPSTSN